YQYLRRAYTLTEHTPRASVGPARDAVDDRRDGQREDEPAQLVAEVHSLAPSSAAGAAAGASTTSFHFPRGPSTAFPSAANCRNASAVVRVLPSSAARAISLMLKGRSLRNWETRARSSYVTLTAARFVLGFDAVACTTPFALPLTNTAKSVAS